VTSFGSIKVFRPENKPAGAADRCVQCPEEIERSCIWSAKKMYLDYGSQLGYMFADTSREAMEKVVRDTDYGRCVYACDNDVPDHQTVNMEFEGGATVSLVMAGYTERNIRTTRISCTNGEIVGDGESLHICRFDGSSLNANGAPFSLRVDNPSRHGGGDFNLVVELLRLLHAGDRDEMRRVTEESLESHLIAFAAEKSRLEGGRVVELG
jgi:predicted dehydrogenase